MSRESLALFPATSSLVFMGVLATPFLALPILGLVTLIGTPEWTTATAISLVGVFG